MGKFYTKFRTVNYCVAHCGSSDSDMVLVTGHKRVYTTTISTCESEDTGYPYIMLCPCTHNIMKSTKVQNPLRRGTTHVGWAMCMHYSLV